MLLLPTFPIGGFSLKPCHLLEFVEGNEVKWFMWLSLKLKLCGFCVDVQCANKGGNDNNDATSLVFVSHSWWEMCWRNGGKDASMVK